MTPPNRKLDQEPAFADLVEDEVRHVTEATSELTTRFNQLHQDICDATEVIAKKHPLDGVTLMRLVIHGYRQLADDLEIKANELQARLIATQNPHP
jgi:uncharacterized protein YoxC